MFGGGLQPPASAERHPVPHHAVAGYRPTAIEQIDKIFWETKQAA
jgi:hypothetical protein